VDKWILITFVMANCC